MLGRLAESLSVRIYSITVSFLQKTQSLLNYILWIKIQDILCPTIPGHLFIPIQPIVWRVEFVRSSVPSAEKHSRKALLSWGFPSGGWGGGGNDGQVKKMECTRQINRTKWQRPRRGLLPQTGSQRWPFWGCNTLTERPGSVAQSGNHPTHLSVVTLWLQAAPNNWGFRQDETEVTTLRQTRKWS